MKLKIIFTLGIVTLLLPFFNFPRGWKNTFFFLLGAAIAGLAYYSRRESRINSISGCKEDRTDSYVQNRIA